MLQVLLSAKKLTVFGMPFCRPYIAYDYLKCVFHVIYHDPPPTVHLCHIDADLKGLLIPAARD